MAEAVRGSVLVVQITRLCPGLQCSLEKEVSVETPRVDVDYNTFHTERALSVWRKRYD